MRRLTLTLTLGLLVAPATAQEASTTTVATPDVAILDVATGWLGWRGPDRNGHVVGVDWHSDFSGLRKIWRVPGGRSYAGPLVAGDRVFDVASDPSGRVTVRALSRTTGMLLWAQQWDAPGSVPFFAARSGEWVRSTPAYDGRLLYVGDMLEVLRAFDGETGQLVWEVDFPARFHTGVPPFGFASSPLVYGEYLYVQAANGIVKLHRDTGESVWRTAPSGDSVMEAGAFSSPMIATIAGQEQVVAFTRMQLVGLAPGDGQVLWSRSVPNFRGMNIVTPVVWNDAVLVSQYQNGTYLYPVGPEAPASEAWRNKGSGYMSTPVVVDDHAYIHLENGRLSCVDLHSGTEAWRTRAFGDYWSMVVHGDRILALDSEGVLRVIRANPERFELLDEIEVAAQSTWAHIAVAGDEVLVRELEGLTLLRWSADTIRPAPGR